jgi:hypothetical protein
VFYDVKQMPVGQPDLALAGLASAVVVLVAVVLHWAGLAQAGLVAARATLTYLGFLLLTVPFVGWRLAPVAPALFLLAVAAYAAFQADATGNEIGCARRTNASCSCAGRGWRTTILGA